MKPFNVYYHMYSGEKLASLNAVRANLRAARRARVVPVTTSRYAAIADGFYRTRLERLGSARWRVSRRGALQTVRFDRAATRAVDFGRSRGIVGQQHDQGSLYVALDPTVERPVVALREIGKVGRPPRAPVPYLLRSRWRVREVVQREARVSFFVQGFGPGRMRWYVPRAGSYAVTLEARDKTVTLKATAGEDGVLEFHLPARAVAGGWVTIRPHGQRP